MSANTGDTASSKEKLEGPVAPSVNAENEAKDVDAAPEDAANGPVAPTEPAPALVHDSKPTRKGWRPWHGLRSQSDKERPTEPLSPLDDAEGARRVTFEANRTNSIPFPGSPLAQHDSAAPSHGSGTRPNENRRRSINPKSRPPEDVYHDSRAATRREFRRRGTTLQDYYRENPALLPQLPFTFRHGFKRWKLGLLILFMIFDACVVPIILYYTLTFAGKVQGWITFAVITSIWGGPAYFEFAVRSWRLILKERFFRPLGVTSRWAFDITNWIFVVSLVATTTLLITGAAPHIVWIRVLSLPGPALLVTLGGCIGLIDIYYLAGWKAPFRLSSTAKGETVHPGIYYIVEDIVAVNAGGGLPFREGFAARYEASPVFRKMIRDQSFFWSIGATVMGIVLIVVVCLHSVKKEVAYGVGWAVPFVWAAVWAVIAIPWVRFMMHKESSTWEEVRGHEAEKGYLNGETDSALAPASPPATASPPTTASAPVASDTQRVDTPA